MWGIVKPTGMRFIGTLPLDPVSNPGLGSITGPLGITGSFTAAAMFPAPQMFTFNPGDGDVGAISPEGMMFCLIYRPDIALGRTVNLRNLALHIVPTPSYDYSTVHTGTRTSVLSPDSPDRCAGDIDHITRRLFERHRT